MNELVVSTIDISRYDDGCALLRGGQPDSVFDSYSDAREAWHRTCRGDAEHSLGSYKYEIKQLANGYVNEIVS